jgi:hypothetical protein
MEAGTRSAAWRTSPSEAQAGGGPPGIDGTLYPAGILALPTLACPRPAVWPMRLVTS